MRKIDTSDFTRATRATAREINRRICLNLVREHEPISRAELARRMGMGRGMVTALANELLSEGAIREGPAIAAPRGRRPTMLYVRTNDRLVIAIDVRFSRTTLMLSDLSGRQLAMDSFETISQPAALVMELAGRIHSLVRAHARGVDVEGIGMVVPGMVDYETGTILHAPQLGWHDIDIRNALAAASGLPVHIQNAPIACALAHLWLDGGEGNFAYVTVSDGVGAGVVVNGQVIRGSSHSAGEFGHIPLELEGPPCLCGSRGCLEAYTSNFATLARYVGHEHSPEESRRLLEAHELTISDVLARAREGEARALAAVRETGRYLGVGISNIVKAMNPARVLVGGEITAVWDLIEEQVVKEIASRALTAASAATPVVPDLASVPPRLRGAIALVTAPMYAAPRVA